MNSFQNMLLKISKLREIKLDKSALESIQRKLRDPETSRKIGLNTKRFIDSENGGWAISVLSASLVSIVIVPPILNGLTETQGMINKYRRELEEMPKVLEELNEERKKYSLLENNEIRLDRYLLNSDRVLFLPEVIRQAAAPHQIKLVSFRPTASGEDNEFFDAMDAPQEEFEDEQIDVENFPEDEDMENLDGELSEDFEEMFGEDGGNSTSGGTDSTNKELIPINYSLQLEGDYLRILSFLRDIQGYQSLIGVESAQFSTGGSTSMESSATDASPTGSVILDMVIQIPTLEG